MPADGLIVQVKNEDGIKSYVKIDHNTCIKSEENAIIIEPNGFLERINNGNRVQLFYIAPQIA